MQEPLEEVISSETRVTNEKKGGGLGVRNLKLHNKSLLLEWLWRYNRRGDEIWEKLC